MIDIDQLARESGATLRDEVARSVEVETSLSALHTRRRRQRRTRLSVAVAAAAAVVGVAGVLTTRDSGGTELVPTEDVTCTDAPAVVRCLSDGRIHVDRPHPFTLTLPAGFTSAAMAVSQGGTELYREGEDHVGVMLFDDAVPARTDRHLTAHQLARWVARRPFLRSDGLQRTTVDGLLGWQVQVHAKGAPPTWTASCNGNQTECWPVLEFPRDGAPPWESGPWQDMASRYTFLDLPDGRTFGIWSWAFDRNWVALRTNDELIRSLRFDQE